MQSFNENHQIYVDKVLLAVDRRVGYINIVHVFAISVALFFKYICQAFYIDPILRVEATIIQLIWGLVKSSEEIYTLFNSSQILFIRFVGITAWLWIQPKSRTNGNRENTNSTQDVIQL